MLLLQPSSAIMPPLRPSLINYLLGCGLLLTCFVDVHSFVAVGHDQKMTIMTPTKTAYNNYNNNQFNKKSFRRYFSPLTSPLPRVHDTLKRYRCGHLSASSSQDSQSSDQSNNDDDDDFFPNINNNTAIPATAGLGLNNDTSTPEAMSTTLATASPGNWPCFDELDRKLIRISLPIIANNAINPLIGAVDLFWVNRMGNALAVAGQAAANQVFSSSFWLISFLPSVTATLVSKKHAGGDLEGTQDAVCQALLIGFVIALLGTPVMFFNSDWALSSVLKAGAPAMEYAKPYLRIRAFAFLPSLISLVGFSAFRGILETRTPVKVSAFANFFNAVLDPILIFTFMMGVPGAALATLAAELISATVYLVLLRKRELIRWRKLTKLPSWASLEPLVKGGMALQLRNVALNLTFIMVARVTQAIDKTGVAAAAHAMALQTFQIGGIVLLALSTVAQTVVPNAMVERLDENGTKVGGIQSAKSTVNRMMSWGFVLGVLLGSIQILLLPAIKKTTPLQEVRDAAQGPALYACVLQIINGLVFIGEGVMVGTGSFMQLSIGTMAATLGCLGALNYFPPRIGLSGVWVGFAVFNAIRLFAVWVHQMHLGPLARRTIRKAAEAKT